MKKVLSLFLTILLISLSLVSCSSGTESKGSQNADSDSTGSGTAIEIVATTFPEYDWVRSILGENPAGINLTLLEGSGVDLHSYQPTVEDMLKIAECGLFLYVGGESDAWVSDALAQSGKEDRIVISLLDALGDQALEEEITEGMQEEAEEEEASEEDAEEAPELDEHVWLSLRNAEILVDPIEQAIETLDPENADTYRSNAEAYQTALSDLDQQYQDAVSQGAVRTLVFGDRFPFRYLVDDYDLNYYAAFAGCSSESEASFETVAFLASKVDELSLRYVMSIEGENHDVAESVIRNTEDQDQQILTLDSMQSVTMQQIENGANYLSIMTSNLGILREALDNTRGSGLTDGAPEPEAIDADAKLSATEGIDIDLTMLSGTMVYAEVYNMMVTPEDFMGKVIRMEGNFATNHDEATGKNYFACIIQDATACCAQGIEFELSGNPAYPDDYPKEDEIVTVTGTFDCYDEGGFTYCTLREASLA